MLHRIINWSLLLTSFQSVIPVSYSRYNSQGHEHDILADQNCWDCNSAKQYALYAKEHYSQVLPV